MVQPGDHATFTVELIQPIAMEEGLTFAVREGGHTVGSAVSPRSSPDSNESSVRQTRMN